MFDLELAWDRPAHTGNETLPHILRARIIPQQVHASEGLPLRMAIALDTSSSMQGEKLSRAKEACEAVARQLRPQDKLWLASFSTQVTPVLNGINGGPTGQAAAATDIANLSAAGITRTDHALQWIGSVLPTEVSVVRIAIVITDGHATDPTGHILQDVSPIIEMASKLGEQCSICTVGLGNAEDFNTSFLNNMSDKGRGAFIFSKSPSELDAQLRSRLSTSQTMAINDATIKLEPLLLGVQADAFCRIDPDYVPFDSPVNGGDVHVGALRSDTPTNILVRVNIPKLPDGKELGNYEVAKLTFSMAGTSLSQTASIKYTNSFNESTKRNDEVENARLIWGINVMNAEASNTTDVNRTGDLLANIQHTATKAGLSQIAAQAADTLDELKKTGKLNQNKSTSLLTSAKDTGNLS